jgi:uncharacterized protein (TIGR03066 family)
MRTLLGCALVLGMAGAIAAAEDKIDAKKLLGKWENKDQKLTVEFLKDGKVSVAGGEFKAEGTYKVDGNKLMLTVKFGDAETKMTRTVSKLTDTELVSKDDESGKEDTLSRVKDKKDK